MIITPPSLLRLRLLATRPQLALTEIQLVDDVLLYRRLDGRDRVPTAVRALRPSASDWEYLRRTLDAASFWLWPRRWRRVHDGYEGEFAIGVVWGGRAAMSAGTISVAQEVDAVLDEVERLARSGPRHAPQPVATLRMRIPTMPDTESEASRSVIPSEADHLVRAMASTVRVGA